MEAHMFCMESGSKSGKLWLAPLIEPKPIIFRSLNTRFKAKREKVLYCTRYLYL